MSTRKDKNTYEGVSLLRTTSYPDCLTPNTAGSSSPTTPGSRAPSIYFPENKDFGNGATSSVWLAMPVTFAKKVFGRRAGLLRTLVLGVLGIAVVIVVTTVDVGGRTPPPPVKSQQQSNPPPPRPWEAYTFLKSYYTGIYNLVNRTDNIPEWPREQDGTFTKADESTRFKQTKSQVYDPVDDLLPPGRVECSFSDYEDEDKEKIGRKREAPKLRTFQGIPAGLPNVAFGSHKLLGLDDNMCYDRYGRYGPYGFGYPEDQGGLGIGVREDWTDAEGEAVEGGYWSGSMPMQKIDWRGVDWGKLTDRCVEKNKHRFWQPPKTLEKHQPLAQLPLITTKEPTPEEMKGKVPRTAILIRLWDEYQYTKNDYLNLRALISETTMATGGQYQVHLLIHVKDNKVPIWSHPDVYQTRLNKIPEEFRGIATLWNEELSRFVYSSITQQGASQPIHGVYRSLFMPVQIFAMQHPEYQFFWNWEYDTRNIGHYLSFLQGMDKFAEAQPRKHLWERSGRYYIPEYHGSWENFTQSIAEQYENPIWGPVPVKGIIPLGPMPPPQTPENDNWGVGEPADLITLGPIFNVNNTRWTLRRDVVNYPEDTPRRSTIVAFSRLSRRLLRAMHTENAINSRMTASEMFPPTVALHHGFKAVFAPHPTYFDRNWPVEKLQSTFNAGPGGQAGGEGSVYGYMNEHNFSGSSWYYNAKWAESVYRRWGGERASNGGGKEVEIQKGRMCLPGIMFHPIKKTDMK